MFLPAIFGRLPAGVVTVLRAFSAMASFCASDMPCEAEPDEPLDAACFTAGTTAAAVLEGSPCVPLLSAIEFAVDLIFSSNSHGFSADTERELQ